jgi:hypothetical protein
MAGGFMGSQSLPLKVRYGERKREETAAGNKMEKEEKKRPCWNPGKKTEPEENNKIKPADLPHIQTNAVTTRPYGQIIHLCNLMPSFWLGFQAVAPLSSHHAMEKVAGLCHWTNR